MADATSRKIIEYTADMKDVFSKLRRLDTANRKAAKGLGTDFNKNLKAIGEGYGKIATTDTRQLTGNITNLAGKTSSWSQVVKDADGNLGKFTETTRINNKGVATTTTSFQKLDKNTVSLGQNLARLAKRAALTIPLWLVLRSAITGTISSFKNSVKAVIEYDKALQKLKKSLQGTPEEIAKNFAKAREEITKFSIEAGKSTDDITRAVQRFATVGFDFETSLSAGLDATRLSILLFGEAEETANAFARGLRVLVTDIDNSAKSSQEIAQALALTSELYETNAFELKELNNGFEKFAGTAKALGFTLEQTLVLLAGLSTRGLNANRAGRLLRTSSLKLTQNLGKLSKVLGVQVNPQLDTTFEIFTKVINAVAELRNESGKISVDVAEAVRELFGGVRGGEPILDIVADIDNVNKAFKKFLSARPDVVKFRQDVDEMNNTLFRQVEIYHNLNKEIGKAFIVGLTGAEDFESGIKRINDVLRALVKNSQDYGTSIVAFFQNLSLQFDKAVETQTQAIDRKESSVVSRFVELGKLASKGLEEGLTETDLQKVFAKIADLRLNLTEQGFNENYFNNLNRVEEAFIKIAATNRKIADEQELIWDEEGNFRKRVEDTNALLEERVDVEQNLAFLRKELAASGLSELEIESAILKAKQQNNLETKSAISQQNQLVEHLKRLEDIELERTRDKGLINNQLQLLKLQGATNLQLVQAEITLEGMYGINQDRLSLLQNELKLQREITTEKFNQEKLSSDSLKIFEIAQKYGRTSAEAVSRFLTGDAPLKAFQPGAKYSDLASVIREYFPNLVKQLQASEYFFKGRGRDISIPERVAFRDFQPSRLEAIQLPEIKTNIDEIRVNIAQTLSRENLSKQIVDEIVKAIQGNDRIQQAINEKIEAY